MLTHGYSNSKEGLGRGQESEEGGQWREREGASVMPSTIKIYF